MNTIVEKTSCTPADFTPVNNNIPTRSIGTQSSPSTAQRRSCSPPRRAPLPPISVPPSVSAAPSPPTSHPRVGAVSQHLPTVPADYKTRRVLLGDPPSCRRRQTPPAWTRSPPPSQRSSLLGPPPSITRKLGSPKPLSVYFCNMHGYPRRLESRKPVTVTKK